MGKRRKSASDKGGVPPVDEGAELDKESARIAPSAENEWDTWNPENIAHTRAAKDSDEAFDRFLKEDTDITRTIEEYASLRRETGKSISGDDAEALAVRIKNLYFDLPFDGRADYLDFRAGGCLKLKEGEPSGYLFTVCVDVTIANPPSAVPELRGTRLQNTLAVPIELTGAFGARSNAWLAGRSAEFAREYERKRFTPAPPSDRLFDDSEIRFSYSLSRISPQPEPGSIPVVLAPNEAAVTAYIEAARSEADYWEALVKAAAALRKQRQPFGDALNDWLIEAASRNRSEPYGTTVEKWPADELRNRTIIKAIAALERCGMKATRNDVSPPRSACDAVARAFGMKFARVMDIWKARSHRP